LAAGDDCGALAVRPGWLTLVSVLIYRIKDCGTEIAGMDIRGCSLLLSASACGI